MRPNILFALVISMVLAGCVRRQEDEDAAESASVKVPVTVATISSGTASVTIRGVGKTDALRKQKVYSPIAGIVTTLHIQEGTSVHSGDIIAIIRSKEAQATIAGAEALLQSAIIRAKSGGQSSYLAARALHATTLVRSPSQTSRKRKASAWEVSK